MMGGTMSTKRATATRSFVLAALLALSACGSGGEPDDEVTSGDEVEQRGEETPAEPIVCRAGSQGGPAEVRACPEGLSCCYPCGVEGCHWVCADAETCASWSPLP
ncbi:MAG: hypothetical protein CMH59_24325 [Myxococcales bacterium]|nr:hypothetical protein [Myxococcales bacterium]